MLKGLSRTALPALPHPCYHQPPPLTAQVTASKPEVQVVQTVGQRLQQRREARGASFEAVTRATRLTRTVLQALEDDRFGDIAAPVYVRGFLRIYAQFLEVDADTVLEAYEQQIAVQIAPQDVGQPLPDAAPGVQMPDYLRGATRPTRALSPAQAFLLVATAAIVVVFLWNVNRKRPVQLARPGVVTAPATAQGPAVDKPEPRKPAAPAVLPVPRPR